MLFGSVYLGEIDNRQGEGLGLIYLMGMGLLSQD